MSLLALGVAHAADMSFEGDVPSIGSKTFPTSYVTTPQQTTIRVTMTQNPYDLNAKAVRCNGGDVSSYKTIRANARGYTTLATNVRDGTCFKLNFDAPTTRSFNIKGKVTY
jgi:hypothetical protein